MSPSGKRRTPPQKGPSLFSLFAKVAERPHKAGLKEADLTTSPPAGPRVPLKLVDNVVAPAAQNAHTQSGGVVAPSADHSHLSDNSEEDNKSEHPCAATCAEKSSARGGEEWQSPEASVGDTFVTPAQRPREDQTRTREGTEVTPMDMNDGDSPAAETTTDQFAGSVAAAPKPRAFIAKEEEAEGRQQKEKSPPPPLPPSSASLGSTGKKSRGRPKKDSKSAALVFPVDAAARAALANRVEQESRDLILTARAQTPPPMSEVDLGHAGAGKDAASPPELKHRVAVLVEGRSGTWEAVAAEIAEVVGSIPGAAENPSMAAVKACVVAVADRVPHCALPREGSDEWDALADDAEEKLWRWRLKDARLLVRCGGADAKHVAEDARMWFSKLQHRLTGLAGVAAKIRDVDALASQGRPLADAEAAVRLAVAVANRADGLDRINALVNARRSKREGKSDDASPATAADLAAVAEQAAAAADAALAEITDPVKLAAVKADALRSKATTTVGRLIKTAANARARAEKEAEKEAAREAKEAERAAKEEAKELERAAKEKAKELERAAKEEAKELERAAKEKAKELERAAKEEERRAREEEKEAERVAKEAAKEAERVAKEEERRAKEAEREAARLAKEKEKDEAKRAKEEALAAKEAERRRLEEARAAAEAKALAARAKQSNAFKSFFASAPRQPLSQPAPVVTAPAAQVAAMDARAMDAVSAAVAANERQREDPTNAADAAAEAARRWEETRARWRAMKGTTCVPGARWGARRAPKRRREGDVVETSADAAALREATRRSLEENPPGDADGPLEMPGRPKRRRLISVQCSSEYEGAPNYRYGFQLDDRENPFRTFPIDEEGSCRPAFWGSGVFPGRPAMGSAAVTGRRWNALDPDVTYFETEEGSDGKTKVWVDSADEWEDEEVGESLSDADDGDDDEEGGGAEEDDERDEEGFVVPDGYLSDGDMDGVAEDDIGDELMDVDDVYDEDADDNDALDAAGGASSPAVVAGQREREAANTRERELRKLTRWMEKARSENRPLVVTNFLPPATPPRPLQSNQASCNTPSQGDSPAGGSVVPAAARANAHLLRALAAVRFRTSAMGVNERGGAAIKMMPPPKNEADDGDGRAGAGNGGNASGKKKRLFEVPPTLHGALLTFLLEHPKLQINKSSTAFAEAHSTAEMDLAKKAVKTKISEMAEYKNSRWEIKAEALAAAGMTAEDAEDRRPLAGSASFIASSAEGAAEAPPAGAPASSGAATLVSPKSREKSKGASRVSPGAAARKNARPSPAADATVQTLSACFGRVAARATAGGLRDQNVEDAPGAAPTKGEDADATKKTDGTVAAL